MNSKLIFHEFITILRSGIKIGILGALIGAILNSVWGVFDAIEYTVVNGFIIGFFVGFFEQIISRTKIGRLPYSLLLILRIVTYFVISIVSIYLLMLVYLKNIGLSSAALAEPELFEEISEVYFLSNINTLYILLIILVVSFLWQFKAFFEKGAIINYLIGKYHKPSAEERIFMFLDLNDATTLAETLGNEKYSSLLNEFFNDIDAAFVKTSGNVHQYVGDEVVVIWKLKNGLKNNNCLKSFFMAIKIMEDKREYYLNKYGIVPSFKASLHLGVVTISEVGASKKEIAYHGDTINTASRICASAHDLGKNILISKDLYDRIGQDENIKFEDLGEHNLKGKNEKIHIYSAGI